MKRWISVAVLLIIGLNTLLLSVVDPKNWTVGQIRMRKKRYSLGAAWAHQDVSATYDPDHRQFVFAQIRSNTRKGKEQPKLNPVRRDAKNLSVEDITGLSREIEELPTRQLMFPFAICHSQTEIVHQGA